MHKLKPLQVAADNVSLFDTKSPTKEDFAAHQRYLNPVKINKMATAEIQHIKVVSSFDVMVSLPQKAKPSHVRALSKPVSQLSSHLEA